MKSAKATRLRTVVGFVLHLRMSRPPRARSNAVTNAGSLLRVNVSPLGRRAGREGAIESLVSVPVAVLRAAVMKAACPFGRGDEHGIAVAGSLLSPAFPTPRRLHEPRAPPRR